MPKRKKRSLRKYWQGLVKKYKRFKKQLKSRRNGKPKKPKSNAKLDKVTLGTRTLASSLKDYNPHIFGK